MGRHETSSKENISLEGAELSSKPMTRRIPIDFTSDPLPSFILIDKRIAHGGLIVGRFEILANSGIWVENPHLSIVVHEGEPFELGWKLQESIGFGRHIVDAGQFHLLPPDQFIHIDWPRNQRIFGASFTQTFIERTLREAFGGRIPDLKPVVAVNNPVIGKLIDCLRQGMDETGPTSLFYLDHIGAMLLLKLYETFGDAGQPAPVIGGLGSSRQRRVVEYIEARLGEELNLGHLAAEVGLTRYHFIRAFRVSLGTSPFRYLNKRRIARAQQLLLDPHLSITEVGLTLGFSSHSHFTETFRKITGTTPSQFRKDRR